ncbi:hypothetical protein J6590_020042 [Homalodisca vitripennis]|nr:hypothetical protein J6590_020042 [Homalodisca vitripennis]
MTSCSEIPPQDLHLKGIERERIFYQERKINSFITEKSILKKLPRSFSSGGAVNSPPFAYTLPEKNDRRAADNYSTRGVAPLSGHSALHTAAQ